MIEYLQMLSAATLTAYGWWKFSKPKQDKILTKLFGYSGLTVKTSDKHQMIPKLIKYQEQPDYNLLIYTIPTSLSLSDFEKHQEAIQH